MKYLLPLFMFLALPAVAEVRTSSDDSNAAQSTASGRKEYVLPPAVAEINNARAERNNKLKAQYQEDLQNAQTDASRTEVMQKYEKLLNPDSITPSSDLPDEQKLKLYQKQIEKRADTLNESRENGFPTVDGLTNNAARAKATRSFENTPTPLRQVFGAEKNQLNESRKLPQIGGKWKNSESNGVSPTWKDRWRNLGNESEAAPMKYDLPGESSDPLLPQN